jgi:hypothetical protein
MKGKITLASLLLAALIGTVNSATNSSATNPTVTLVLPQGFSVSQIVALHTNGGPFCNYTINQNQVTVALNGCTKLQVMLNASGVSNIPWVSDVVAGTTYTLSKSTVKTTAITSLNNQLNRLQNPQMRNQIASLQAKLNTSDQQIVNQIINLKTQLMPSPSGQRPNLQMTQSINAQITGLQNQITPANQSIAQQIIALQMQLNLIQNQINLIQNQIAAINGL